MALVNLWSLRCDYTDALPPGALITIGRVV